MKTTLLTLLTWTSAVLSAPVPRPDPQVAIRYECLLGLQKHVEAFEAHLPSGHGDSAEAPKYPGVGLRRHENSLYAFFHGKAASQETGRTLYVLGPSGSMSLRTPQANFEDVFIEEERGIVQFPKHHLELRISGPYTNIKIHPGDAELPPPPVPGAPNTKPLPMHLPATPLQLEELQSTYRTVLLAQLHSLKRGREIVIDKIPAWKIELKEKTETLAQENNEDSKIKLKAEIAELTRVITAAEKSTANDFKDTLSKVLDGCSKIADTKIADQTVIKSLVTVKQSFEGKPLPNDEGTKDRKARGEPGEKGEAGRHQ